MSMTVQVAAMRINRELNQSEVELDRALGSSAALLATMMQARIETDAPAATGHAAILRLVRSLQALGEARGDLVRVHGELLKVGQERADLPYNTEGCPSNGSAADESRRVA